MRREQVSDLLQRRLLVKGTLMRATQHLVTATDYLVLRPALQPALSRWAQGVLRRRAPGLDLARLTAAARPFFDEPHSATELRAYLRKLYPEADVAGAAIAVQTHLALLQVPVRGAVWGLPGNPKLVNADTWLGRPLSPATGPRELVVRYLAAFGPARVADIQAWSGVSRLGDEVARLRPDLRVLRDARGRELVDLPGAPLPSARRAADPRFVPEWDETLLAYADRSRIVPDAFRQAVYATSRLIGPAVLVDGQVAALWTIDQEAGAATVVVRPLAPLPDEARAALVVLGERLAGFVCPDAATRAVRFAGGSAARPRAADTGTTHPRPRARTTPAQARADLRAADPALGRLIDERPAIDPWAWRASWPGDTFALLVRTIVGQQISTAAAAAIFGRVRDLLAADFSPAGVARCSDGELLAAGLSRAKLASLRDLSARILDGSLDLGRLDELSDDELRRRLLAVRGIGPWTVELLLIALAPPGRPAGSRRGPATRRARRLRAGPPAERRRGGGARRTLATPPLAGRRLPVRLPARLAATAASRRLRARRRPPRGD